MPLSTITFIITTLFLLVSALMVFNSYRENKSVILKYFSGFLFGIAFASGSWGTGSLLASSDPQIASFTYPFGVLCGGIGLTFFTRVGFNFTLPKFEKIIFWLLICGNIGFATFLLFKLPDVKISDSGVTLWLINSFQAFCVITIGIGMTILNLGLFIYQSLKVTKKILKIRSILISIAFLFYMTGGLAHNIATTQISLILIDTVTTLGAGLLVFAIYLPRFTKNNQE
ncbi:hypothetical protein A2X44_02545 [candidate division CPR3 bacterium GWF2_35_18]|uniref:Histidine kinase N-terminal 7TM region domain-containing protein n=1 Tax=candidate division CPR3 bacterium GW2011_GWF2_35_18 TaxID=1618350 RepID=A0A0G0E3Z4_UNCC3|nr:MAG: hypothetical protein UR67_C0002G0190 [candidate division CPR3 bacterium GW2011_GWF2_35_18]OGB62873.1 MAG: hypothetical protein A2X44_02545 [candidate division CPR3 bacterium GWF2_35_18]OGB65454.1 MAG: hypothetical protein A2250_00760 [candidate division CPR3 bacterium RIFOXYA2_FULL_35_13]OGB75872.1 MAG: hypothetical protein A2476_03185 [candidate division CPR3 bacterium RIFOXYC2_FULL_35_7]OGB78912.1 MAG: hypothetical protein A2296_04280 [candidate division CPR3 bacterium RIFOXYB2_FULL_3